MTHHLLTHYTKSQAEAVGIVCDILFKYRDYYIASSVQTVRGYSWKAWPEYAPKYDGKHISYHNVYLANIMQEIDGGYKKHVHEIGVASVTIDSKGVTMTANDEFKDGDNFDYLKSNLTPPKRYILQQLGVGLWILVCDEGHRWTQWTEVADSAIGAFGGHLEFFTRVTPEPLIEPDEFLLETRRALWDYYKHLDARTHAGSASSRVISRLEDLLGIQWYQGITTDIERP